MLEAGVSSLEVATADAQDMCEKVTCDVEPVGGKVNSNNAYLKTKNDAEGKDGAQFYVLKVTPENVMEDKKDGKKFIFRATKSASPAGKKILACEFFPEKEVLSMIRRGDITDLFVPAGITIAGGELEEMKLRK